MKEILNIHIGQAGVQAGSSFWELFCLEHGIQPDGVMPERHQEDKSFRTFFCENKEGKFTPRSLFFDLDPTTIDEVRTGIYRNLFPSEYLMNGKEDAADNYARGHYTIGRDYIDKVLAKIRNLLEKCDNFQGFILTHSLGGGTGSGFGSLISSRLSTEYPSKSLHNYCVMPSPNLSNSVVEPYNALLSLADLNELENLLFFFDNESLYEICKNQLEVENPRYRNINRMMAQVVSNITSGLRFEGGLNCNLKEIETNLVPFPKMKNLLTAYAPFRSIEKAYHEYMSVANLTTKVFNSDSLMIKCSLKSGKLLAGCLLYRGDVSPKEINSAVANLRQNKDIVFADCSSNSFKIGINYQTPVAVPGGDIAKTSRSSTLICNSQVVSEFYDRTLIKSDKLLTKSVFVHWFVGEGMEHGVFYEAKENLKTLLELYKGFNDEGGNEEKIEVENEEKITNIEANN